MHIETNTVLRETSIMAFRNVFERNLLGYDVKRDEFPVLDVLICEQSILIQRPKGFKHKIIICDSFDIVFHYAYDPKLDELQESILGQEGYALLGKLFKGKTTGVINGIHKNDVAVICTGLKNTEGKEDVLQNFLFAKSLNEEYLSLKEDLAIIKVPEETEDTISLNQEK